MLIVLFNTLNSLICGGQHNNVARAFVDDLNNINYIYNLAKVVFTPVVGQAADLAAAHWLLFSISGIVTAAASAYIYKINCIEQPQFYKIPRDHSINELLLKANEISPPKSLEELRERALIEAQNRIEYMKDERLTIDVNLLHKPAPDYSSSYEELRQTDNVHIAMNGYNPEQLKVLREVVVNNRKLLVNLEHANDNLNKVKGFIDSIADSSAKDELVTFCSSLDNRMKGMRQFVSEFSTIDAYYKDRKFHTEYLLKFDTDTADITHLSVLARFKVAFQHHVFELKKTTSTWNAYSEKLSYHNNGAANLKALQLDNPENLATINNLLIRCDNVHHITNELARTYGSIFYKYWPQIDQFLTVTSARENTAIVFKDFEGLADTLPRMLPAWDQVKQDPATVALYMPDRMKLMDEALSVAKQITPNVLHYTDPRNGDNILWLSNLQSNTLQLQDLMQFFYGHHRLMYVPRVLEVRNNYYYHTVTEGMSPAHYIATHPDQEVLIRAIDSSHNWAFHRAFIHPVMTDMSFNNKGRWLENFLVGMERNRLHRSNLVCDALTNLPKHLIHGRPKSPYSYPLSNEEWAKIQNVKFQAAQKPIPKILPEHHVLLENHPGAGHKVMSYADWALQHPMYLNMSRLPAQTLTDDVKLQALADWAINPATGKHIETVSQLMTMVSCYT